MSAFQATVEIHSGSNLKVADKSGSSDPFMICYLASDKKHSFKSQVIKQDLNPKWETTWSVHATPSDDLILEVWDKDKFGKDFLGTTSIKASSLTDNKQEMTLTLAPRSEKDKDISGDIKVTVSKSEIAILKSSKTKVENHVIVPILSNDLTPLFDEMVPGLKKLVSVPGLLHMRHAILQHYGPLKGSTMGTVQESTQYAMGQKIRGSTRSYKFQKGTMVVACSWTNDKLTSFRFQSAQVGGMYTQPTPVLVYANFAKEWLKSFTVDYIKTNMMMGVDEAKAALEPLAGMDFSHEHTKDELVVPEKYSEGFTLDVKLKATAEDSTTKDVFVTVYMKPFVALIKSVKVA